VDSNKLKNPIIAEVLPSVEGKLIYADEAITDQLVTISAPANTPILRAATTITQTKRILESQLLPKLLWFMLNH
jgi:hypothetical protein